MDVSELVQSKWLTAQDVKDNQVKNGVATIVVIGVGEQQEAVSTKGEKYKALVLPVQIDAKTKDWKVNRNSLKKLVSKLGADTASWVGQKVVLTTMLMQGGKEGITVV